jgi:cupin superfamily acireductone dioxygenase involved in methionine salvage
MKDTNEEKAREISKKCGMKYEDDQFRIVADSRPDCYAAAKEMANDKDEVLKKFLEEHANPDMEMEYNEDGVPLAESFIEWNEARLKAGDALFKRYKEYEETWL